MRKKKEVWILATQAASIMSEKNSRVVSPDYVRLRAYAGKIAYRKRDGRTLEYLQSDVEAYRMRPQIAGATQ